MKEAGRGRWWRVCENSRWVCNQAGAAGVEQQQKNVFSKGVHGGLNCGLVGFTRIIVQAALEHAPLLSSSALAGG